MDSNHAKSGPEELRRRAEDRLQRRPADDPPSQADTLRQLHELQVHQIELGAEQFSPQRRFFIECLFRLPRWFQAFLPASRQMATDAPGGAMPWRRRSLRYGYAVRLVCAPGNNSRGSGEVVGAARNTCAPTPVWIIHAPQRSHRAGSLPDSGIASREWTRHGH